jgi:acyl carrier protein
MTVHDRLEGIFRRVFADPGLALTRGTRAADIKGWDSLAHINLMFSIEQAFGVQFIGNQLAEFNDVGELLDFLERQTRFRV